MGFGNFEKFYQDTKSRLEFLGIPISESKLREQLTKIDLELERKIGESEMNDYINSFEAGYFYRVNLLG